MKFVELRGHQSAPESSNFVLSGFFGAPVAHPQEIFIYSLDNPLAFRSRVNGKREIILHRLHNIRYGNDVELLVDIIYIYAK